MKRFLLKQCCVSVNVKPGHCFLLRLWLFSGWLFSHPGPRSWASLHLWHQKLRSLALEWSFRKRYILTCLKKIGAFGVSLVFFGNVGVWLFGWFGVNSCDDGFVGVSCVVSGLFLVICCFSVCSLRFFVQGVASAVCNASTVLRLLCFLCNLFLSLYFRFCGKKRQKVDFFFGLARFLRFSLQGTSRIVIVILFLYELIQLLLLLRSVRMERSQLAPVLETWKSGCFLDLFWGGFWLVFWCLFAF